jgi:hypothetical protein
VIRNFHFGRSNSATSYIRVRWLRRIVFVVDALRQHQAPPRVAHVATANSRTLADDLARLIAVKARHEEATAALCEEYLRQRDAKEATERQRDQLRDRLEQHRTAVFPDADLAPGEPSFRSTLSAGDRNTLALAFFFASLDQNQITLSMRTLTCFASLDA